MTTPVAATWLPLRRRLRSLAHKALMVAMIVAAAIGLTRLDPRAFRTGQGSEPDGPPGSGMIVRAEVLHLWLPEVLIDRANHPSDSSASPTHRESPTPLERRGREDLWYGLTIRGHQVNGGAAEMAFIRHPYRDPQHFREFLDVLATAAGNPPRHSNSYYARAQVHILPGEQSGRQPREVIEDWFSRSLLHPGFSRGSRRDQRIPSGRPAVDGGFSTRRPRSPRRSSASPSPAGAQD